MMNKFLTPTIALTAALFLVGPAKSQTEEPKPEHEPLRGLALGSR